MKKHIIATLATAAALSTGLSMAPITAVAATPSTPPTKVVDKQNCAPIGHLGAGECVSYTAGSGRTIYNWFGTYQGPDGPGWGLDYLYGTDWSAAAPGSDRVDVNAHGSAVGEGQQQALAALATYSNPATVSDEDGAAIALIIREVMGDGDSPAGGQVIPTGLKAGGAVKPAGVFSASSAVHRRAQALWNYASSHRAPSVTITTPTTRASVGDRVIFTVAVVYADGTPAPHHDVTLNYAEQGGPATMSGPDEVSTGSDGRATFSATVGSGGIETQAWFVEGTAHNVPWDAPFAWAPSGWAGRDSGAYPDGSTRLLGHHGLTQTTGSSPAGHYDNA